jgi:hypothetical protein
MACKRPLLADCVEEVGSQLFALLLLSAPYRSPAEYASLRGSARGEPKRLPRFSKGGVPNVCLRSPLRFQCARLNGRQPLCNDREKTLHFVPQVRNSLAIAREMPQQASLEESIKQRIEGAPGNDGLSVTK